MGSEAECPELSEHLAAMFNTASASAAIVKRLLVKWVSRTALTEASRMDRLP